LSEAIGTIVSIACGVGPSLVDLIGPITLPAVVE
jgi:hypothetical protein